MSAAPGPLGLEAQVGRILGLLEGYERRFAALEAGQELTGELLAAVRKELQSLVTWTSEHNHRHDAEKPLISRSLSVRLFAIGAAIMTAIAAAVQAVSVAVEKWLT